MSATTNPEEALELLASGSFAGCVLDLRMPQLSGFEVLTRLRSLAHGRTLPVLFLSAQAGPNERAQAFRLGADDFLSKPFDPEELVARIERLVGRQQPQHGLDGDLASFPLPSLLQDLRNNEQSGVLTVRSPQGVGQIALVRGLLTTITSGHLRQREALIELLSLPHGRFEFLPIPTTRPVSDGRNVPLESCLLEASWLLDERERSPNVPPIAAELAPGPPPESIPEDLKGQPVLEVYAQFRIAAHRRLADLLPQLPYARSRVEVVTAWLRENGHLVPAAQGPPDRERPQAAPAPLTALAQAARKADPGSGLLHLVWLYDPSLWSKVRELLSAFPTEVLEDPPALTALQASGRGSLPLRSSAVLEILLDVAPLPAPGWSGAETAPCWLLWLGDESRQRPPRALLTSSATSRRPVRGAVFCTSAAVLSQLTATAAGSESWLWRDRLSTDVAELFTVASEVFHRPAPATPPGPRAPLALNG